MTETFGFRKVEFRKDGFYLNGVRRQLRRVNYHQDREGCGWAVTDTARSDSTRTTICARSIRRGRIADACPAFHW